MVKQPPANSANLTSVSCTSPDFCMAVGYDENNQNYACSYINQVWSCNTINAQSTYGNGLQLQSVSCVNPNFCMAIDLYGAAFLYSGNPASWSDPTTISRNAYERLYSISCSSTNLCVVVDVDTNNNNGNAYTYQNGSWSHGVSVSNYGFGAVSCSSNSFCTAVDSANYAYYYNGVTWSAPQATGNNATYGFASISCPINLIDIFCMAGNNFDFDTGYNGNTYIYTTPSNSWSITSLNINNSPIPSLSCSSSKFCVATSGGSVYA